MSKHLHRALEDLDKGILAIGAMVEESINKAIVALVSRRPQLAEEVIAGDDAIDRREVEFEEECMRILALHQPVATDLRFIVAVMKVNNDLERMGDLAANIADRALYLARHEPLQASLDFTAMVSHVRAMVRKSLDALVNMDAAMAREVCAQDDEVDKLNHAQRKLLMEVMRSDPANLDRALQTLFASRHLERIADHAVNIAEDVVYMVEGDVIRHARAFSQPAGVQPSNNGSE